MDKKLIQQDFEKEVGFYSPSYVWLYFLLLGLATVGGVLLFGLLKKMKAAPTDQFTIICNTKRTVQRVSVKVGEEVLLAAQPLGEVAKRVFDLQSPDFRLKRVAAGGFVLLGKEGNEMLVALDKPVKLTDHIGSELEIKIMAGHLERRVLFGGGTDGPHGPGKLKVQKQGRQRLSI